MPSSWFLSTSMKAFSSSIAGQKVNLVVPQNLHLPTSQQKEIAMMAFPDSNNYSDYEGTFKYICRVKKGEFGFVCFKQRKDQGNARGYSQQSFIILTRLPFLNFFQKMSEYLVFKLFNLPLQKIKLSLLHLLSQIEKWPSPTPLSNYILPVLDSELSVSIPNYLYSFDVQVINKMESISHRNRQGNKEISLDHIVTQEALLRYGIFQQVRITQLFCKCPEEMWQAWEAVLLNRAMLVMGSNPYTASMAVLGAVSLINPFQYGGQYMPYVTVYDARLNQLQEKCKDVVFGGTNPLFLKLFSTKKLKIVSLVPNGKVKQQKSQIKPLKQLLIIPTSQEQRAITQSSIRRYFYKLNQSLISLFDEYFGLQINDLKFWNEKDWAKWIKSKKDFGTLQQVYGGRRNALDFLQQFITSINFSCYLKNRNIVRQKMQK